ncbi:MAG TPA: deaminase, partial [Candidatus Paceibacterota bacterium]|nr:deaminase [Candidatus Paceibacterota bacterium]
GVSVQGCTMYTTTFPCHECARLIVAAGIERVVYVEAYPKSRVAQLYDDSIALAAPSEKVVDKVSFQPFVGIGPRRFEDLFSDVTRKKRDLPGNETDLSGDIVDWNIRTAQVRETIVFRGIFKRTQHIGVLEAEAATTELVRDWVRKYRAERRGRRKTTRRRPQNP